MVKLKLYAVYCSGTGRVYYFDFKPLKKDLIKLGEQEFGLDFGDNIYEEFSVAKIHINDKDAKNFQES